MYVIFYDLKYVYIDLPTCTTLSLYLLLLLFLIILLFLNVVTFLDS